MKVCLRMLLKFVLVVKLKLEVFEEEVRVQTAEVFVPVAVAVMNPQKRCNQIDFALKTHFVEDEACNVLVGYEDEVADTL